MALYEHDGSSGPEGNGAPRQRGRAPAGPDQPLDLKDGHISTPHCARTTFRARVFSYPGGEHEVVTAPVYHAEPSGGHRPGGDQVARSKGPIDPELQAINRKAKNQRAASQVRRLVRSAALDHLASFTFRENLQDGRIAWQCWARFVRVLRRMSGGRQWPYLVVMERQDRGAIHFHAAVKGRQDVRLLRAAWHEAIGGPGCGNIDVQGPRGRSIDKVAGYLGKYLAKDMGDRDPGEHRFRRSLGIELVQIVRRFVTDGLGAIEATRRLMASLGHSRAFVKVMENTGGGFGCVWSSSWATAPP